MKGFVPTPRAVVDHMVDKLFAQGAPPRTAKILDPGCGDGAFIEGIARWCENNGVEVPDILGVESDPQHVTRAQAVAASVPPATIIRGDFLTEREGLFDFIIANPPYVPITGLSAVEREDYRRRFSSAQGRFDLYFLFFEQAMRMLKPNGRLVFITPEKFLYVRSAAPLRKALGHLSVEEIELVDEATFGGLVTYPTITTVVNVPPTAETLVINRDRTTKRTRLPADGTSWLHSANGTASGQPSHRLKDACLRISCGVATGADSVYVIRTRQVPTNLKSFALPTIAGREIGNATELHSEHSMLTPYSSSGELLPEHDLGDLREYLNEPDRRAKLERRTCAARKRWYAFHENPPFRDILKPKILCKDIAPRPHFIVDRTGEIVPRHSVYYLVPSDYSRLDDLCDYLNSKEAQEWLIAHCQRAANSFIRLQSHVLKQLPIPAELVGKPCSAHSPVASAESTAFSSTSAHGKLPFESLQTIVGEESASRPTR